MEKRQTAIYSRVSTLKASQKDSPEHQKSLCEAHAKDLDLSVIYPVYEDRDTGTSIIARPEVQKMVRDAQRGLFDTILFSSLSRFSRDALDSISLKRLFVNALGIRLISIEDFYDSKKEDNEMMFGIVSVVNQKLSEQISTASKRGIRQSAIKGNYTGSIAPYGYKKEKIGDRKTLVIDPERAEVIRLIFELYCYQKMGDKAITNYLNGDEGSREPILSYRGDKWGVSSVQRILMNEVYTGQNVFSKHEVKKVYNDVANMTDRKKVQIQKNIINWERSDFKTHESIISETIFKQAQEIRLFRGGGKRGGNKVYVNIFAKLIFCKCCGTAMVTMSSNVRGVKYQYLMCSRRRRQGPSGCSNKRWIPYPAFRDEMMELIIGKLSHLINNDAGTDSLMNQISLTQRDYEKEISKYNKKIEENRRLVFSIRKQMMLDNIDETQYEYEKAQYEGEIKTFEEVLLNLQSEKEKKNDSEMLKAKIKEAVNELLTLSDYSNTEKTRIILSKLIQKIIVDGEGNVDLYTPLGQI